MWCLCTWGNNALTLCQVWRPAAKELAPLQQALERLHDEAWAGCKGSLSQKISQEVEIVSGCAVAVSNRPSPFITPVPPGPGRVIRNMLGWSQLEKTDESGVWFFGVPSKGRIFFSSLDVAGDWERKGSYHTVRSVPCDSSCTCSYACGQGPAIGPHTEERCWPLLAGAERAIAPLMKPVCAKGDVSTAANLNLYPGRTSRVGWHSDGEPLFGECGEAKHIVSVTFGTRVLST